MTEAQHRRHGLEAFIDDASQRESTKSKIAIEVRSGLAHINLRGNAKDQKFIEAVENALEQPLPVEPNTMSVRVHHVYWMGPNEWLILTAIESADTVMTRLSESLCGMSAAVNDIGGGQIALRLTGQHVADVLAKGCTLDLHPRVFAPGMCAQSGLAKANVLIGCIERIEGQDTFDIVVRRSFADYLLHWLEHAANEYGVRFTAS